MNSGSVIFCSLAVVTASQSSTFYFWNVCLQATPIPRALKTNICMFRNAGSEINVAEINQTYLYNILLSHFGSI